ncbi:membrane protein [Alsobacter metallidurans]|uniref:Membrane protein n=1 Tax=Alsobacter metallidurans TaxID=340221 RepID=A0A917MJL8_9HYPH|nr:EamA family transporter [Alsobacter metallidurans]GGH32333.1 membrane protein [Alsobacter metallidurans]
MFLATLSGFGAILLWSALALLTAASGAVPPFQLLALTFAIGGGMGAASWAFRPGAWRSLRQPWPVWALGVGGLFGYHALYYAALRLAPPAEASLVAYLWPLLIVLFSALLPGERLKGNHVVGALLGLAGVAVLITGRSGGLTLDPAATPGYLLALGCAFVWSGYSVLSRRFGAVPTDAVVGFCLVTAALALVCHLAFETTVWPNGAAQWLAVIGLGLGPVGAAFYLWDHGVKHGEIRVLGVASYAAPVLSTIILVAAGAAAATWSLGVATALIVGGALLASLDMLRRKVS